MYYAHSSATLLEDQWHPLATHLNDVASLAQQFSAAFNGEQAAWLCGLLHDLGKYSPEFQQRLRGGKRVDHSLAGAVEALRYFGKGKECVGNIFAHIISAHHTGLANGVSSEEGEEESKPTLKERLDNKATIPNYGAWIQEIELPPCPPLQKVFPAIRNTQEAPAALYFWCKMLFSCLVDADCLDTEHALNPEKATLRGNYPDLATLKTVLDDALQQKTAAAEATTVNKCRADVLASCRNAAQQAQGFFSLTVPTGGGKTLSSLAFALDHAIKHNLHRIIYVIPYTSIIEQTADVFRKTFGPQLAHAVVEHHCNAFVEQEAKTPNTADDTENLQSLAWENWDAPIIVTTSVQFYESLYAANKSSCRKLHNIAKSVIILDEAQTLPVRYLRPCLAALNQLVTTYNSSVVLCTATQPKLETAPWLREGLDSVQEIIENPQQLFTALKRVTIEHGGKLSIHALAAALSKHPQVLCIVNTRKQARETCEELELLGVKPFHLSTWMYPQHRKEVLQKIRDTLKAHQPCVVVATSLIEAGVDISFPVVYRAISGVDSIAQAAGRCNREGEAPIGITYVFEPEGKVQGEQSRRIHAGKEALESYEDILMPEAVSAYFKELYNLEGANNLDAKNILGSMQGTANNGYFPFRSIARSFKIIEEETMGVLIQANEEAKQAINRLNEAFPSRAEARKLQQWTVALRRSDWHALRQSGAIVPYGFTDSWFVLENQDIYNETFGLDTRNPAFRRPESNIM